MKYAPVYLLQLFLMALMLGLGLGSVSAQSEPVIVASPPTLEFTGDFTQATEIPSRAFNLKNMGSSPLTWTLETDRSWLFWESGSGTVAAGASSEVRVWVDLWRLANVGPGTYTALLRVSSPAAADPAVTVPVTAALTDVPPADPALLPPSKRFNLEVYAGRLRLINGSDALAVMVDARKVNAAQPATDTNLVLQDPNGEIVDSVIAGPYHLERRRGFAYTYDQLPSLLAGEYTASFLFEDETVARAFQIPGPDVVLPTPQPHVSAFADGSLSVDWEGVTGAVSYTVDLYEIMEGDTFEYVTGSNILTRSGWGFPAGTLKSGKRYLVTVTALNLDPFRRSPDGNTFLGSSGASQEVTLTEVAPPLVSADAQIDLCGRDATITWTTSEPSSTEVNYGRTSGYGLWTRNLGEYSTLHRVVVKNLDPGTEFHFQAYSSTTQGAEFRSVDLARKVSPRAGGKRGDLNLDGKVDVSDAILSLRYAVNLAEPGSDPLREVSDVNGDAKLNVADAIVILRVAVGLERDCWPAEL